MDDELRERLVQVMFDGCEDCEDGFCMGCDVRSMLGAVLAEINKTHQVTPTLETDWPVYVVNPQNEIIHVCPCCGGDPFFAE